jgi:hypothetical protein
MGTANFSINHNAILSALAEDVSAGMAVLKAPTGYVPATAANRTLYSKRADGIALDDGEAEEVIRVAHDGLVDEDHTNLGAGAATWVIVASDGTLERDSTPDAGDDVVGKCDVYGNLHATFNTFDEGNYAGGGAGFTPPTGTGFMTTTAGAMNAAATAFPATLAMGGTGATSLAAGLIQSNGTVLSTTGFGTGLQLMRTNAGANGVEWWTLSVNLGTQVTGTLALGSVAAPTGTGLATVTGGAWDAASASVAAGFLTFAATPSSANLRSLVTDETGTGALVFANTPTLVTPEIGAATGTSLVTTAQLAAGTFVSVGGTVASTGSVRLADESTVYGVSGGTNYRLFYFTAGNLNIGESGAGVTNVVMYGQNSITLAIGSTTMALIDSTGLRLNDGGGQYYTFSPSNLAADRTITLPLLTGNDTMVTEAHTQTLTNKTLTSPTINGCSTSGTWSGTPTFSGAVTFSGGVRIGGANYATTGTVNYSNNVSVYARNAANSGDERVWTLDNSNNLSFGSTANAGSTYLQSGSSGALNYLSNTHAILTSGGSALLNVSASAIAANVAIVEKESAMGALAIDWALGNSFTKTLASGGNTITFSNDTNGETITVCLTTHASGSTVTWPAGVKWSNGGAEPTQTATGGAIDIYTLKKIAGTVYGVHQANFA